MANSDQSDPMKMQALLKIIEDLENQIDNLKSRFPAHSLTPAMLEQLDELDETLVKARQKLQHMQNDC